jgi:hypothetical protein
MGQARRMLVGDLQVLMLAAPASLIIVVLMRCGLPELLAKRPRCLGDVCDRGNECIRLLDAP